MEILETRKGQRIDEQRTICEVHRALADLIVVRLQDRPEVITEIMPHLDEAFILGIRLVKALMDRKIEMPEWAKNNYAEAAKLRQERNKLIEALNANSHCL